MKKKLFLFAVASAGVLYAQQKTGINTTSPKATLDVVADTPNTTNDLEGILVPRVSMNKAYQMGTNTDIKESTLVFVDNTADYTTTPVDASVEDITKNGYYFWNGTKWVAISTKDDIGWLDKITENGKTGYRIRGVEPNNYGDTGTDAVDLGFSNNASTTVGALGDNSNISGGLNNSVLSKTSVIGGGTSNQITQNAPIVSPNGTLIPSSMTIGGGQNNTITAGSSSVIGGGVANNISALGVLAITLPDGAVLTVPTEAASTISGGRSNNVRSAYSSIGGGTNNTIADSSDNSTIAGGFVNNINSGGVSSTIAGGANNTVAANYTVVSGGSKNTVLGASSVISGGINNNISSIGFESNISGGKDNKITSGYNSNIGGGLRNEISGNSSVIAGGHDNKAVADAVVTGGSNNDASGLGSVIAGGSFNITSGSYSSTFAGLGLRAPSRSTTAMGVYNTIEANPEVTTFADLTKRLFVLGNGPIGSARSDAFTILRNAKVGIDIDNFENTTSDAKLQVNGLIESRTINSNAGASTDKVVVADANGVFKTVNQSSVGASKWTNDATNTVVKLTNLSDGTTARPNDSNIYIKDNGKFRFNATEAEIQTESGANPDAFNYYFNSKGTFADNTKAVDYFFRSEDKQILGNEIKLANGNTTNFWQVYDTDGSFTWAEGALVFGGSRNIMRRDTSVMELNDAGFDLTLNAKDKVTIPSAELIIPEILTNAGTATDKLVVADTNGVLKTVNQSTLASKWTNDATNTVVKLTNLSDGTTARPNDSNIYIKDNGKFRFNVTDAEIQTETGVNPDGFNYYFRSKGLFSDNTKAMDYVFESEDNQIILNTIKPSSGTSKSFWHLYNADGSFQWYEGGLLSGNNIIRRNTSNMYLNHPNFDLILNAKDKVTIPSAELIIPEIVTNAGASTDKLVVADTNGVLKTVDQSSLSGGELIEVTAGGNTGYRLKDYTAANYSDTGNKAITLGYSDVQADATNKFGASGDYSIVLGGLKNNSNGIYSSVLGGANNKALGDYSSVVGGSANTSSLQYSTVFGGNGNNNNGYQSTILGGVDNTVNSSFSSILSGFNVTTESAFVIGMGRYNTVENNPEATAFTNFSKRLLVIGNGNNATTKSDAFTILRNGKVGIDIDNFEDTTSNAKLQVNGLIESRTINSNAGTSTDKVVVADANGVLKSVDRNGFSEVVGNEVLDATPNGGLVRSGSGTDASPYTLGLGTGTKIGQKKVWNGTSWVNETQSILAPQEYIALFGNVTTCTSQNEGVRFNNGHGDYNCQNGQFIYEGMAFDNSGVARLVHITLPSTYALTFNHYFANPGQSYGLSDNCFSPQVTTSDTSWTICAPHKEIRSVTVKN